MKTRRIISGIRRHRVGCGIAVRGPDLVVVAVRARRRGIAVLGRTVLQGFRERSPVEWGAEYSAFVRGLGLAHVAASFCLPRDEMVVRTLRLPSMRPRELAGAVALQVDELHPYENAATYHSTASLDKDHAAGRRCRVAVAIAEADRIEGYADLFSEAGVRLASCGVSAGALRAATRLSREEPKRPFAVAIRAGEHLEIYGESEDCPSLSSALDLGGITLTGALRLALEGLRPGAQGPVDLALLGGNAPIEPLPGFVIRDPTSFFGSPVDCPEEFALERDAVALGAAMESASSDAGLGLNLLPVSRRRSNSLRPFAPRLALVTALILVVVASLVRPQVQDTRYKTRLRDAIAGLESGTSMSETDQADLAVLRSRYQWLSGRRDRTRSHLDLLREFSEILPQETVLSDLEVDDARSVLTGTAKDADSLLALIAASPRVSQARFTKSPSIVQDGELFQIEARQR